MTCEKCAGPVNAVGKCSACGHDNTSVHPAEDYEWTPKSMRSGRLTIFMYLTIALELLLVVFLLVVLLHPKAVSPFSTGTSVFFLVWGLVDIIIALCVLQLKKWALYAYFGVSVIVVICQLLQLNFIPIILRGVLLYFVFKEDWSYFE